MVKIVVGVVVIAILGGGLVYLDSLEKKERAATEEMRHALEQARANSKK